MHSRCLSPADVAVCARNADEIGKVVNSLAAKGVKSWGKLLISCSPSPVTTTTGRLG
jgi:hypothetical protein